MEDLLKMVDTLTIMVNPHNKERESVATYLTRHNLQDEMSARTFIEMHKAHRMVRLEATGPLWKHTVYATTLDGAITKTLNILKNDSLKEKPAK